MSGKRVAVVSGSNKGIGFAIVKELCAKFDGDVYLTSRDENRGKSAVEEMNKLGLHPKYHQLDVDNQDSVTKLRDYMKSTYGGLDVLVNNAAIAFKSTATESFGEQATVTLRTNFFNTHTACKILFPILKPHARVVNLSSVMGHYSMLKGEKKAAAELKNKLASPDLTEEELSSLMQNFVIAANKGDHESYGWPSSTYAASKIGVSALTRIQQRQFNQDPREDLIVNSVHPGWVDTDMTSHKGPLKVEEGAAAPSWLALIPKNAEGPKGCYVWHDKQIVDWVEGPMPAAY